MTIELLFLRIVHIVGGIFWVGGTLLTTFFLFPALRTLGAAAGPVFAAVQQRKLSGWMLTAALLTVLSGLRLLWIPSGGYQSAYFATAPGMGFSTAGLSAIVAFVLGTMIVRPAAMGAARIGASIASAPPEQRGQLSAEVARLGKRSAIGGTIVAALLVLAAAGMAMARYLV